MIRMDKTKSAFFAILNRDLPFLNASWRLAASTVAIGLFVNVGLPASAFQYPKYLQFSQASPAPIAARSLCTTYVWACSKSSQAKAIKTSDFGLIDKVNRSINHSVDEISDLQQFRSNDVWTLPTKTGGDCEDFALLKKQTLIKYGLPAQSLLIATVLDQNNQGHAVLIVRTQRGDLVLDNLTDQIRTWSQTGLTFLRMQNPEAPNRWVSLAMAN